MFEKTRIDGNGLRPAEHYSAWDKRHKKRQYDRTERVNVLYRIQRQPSRATRGRIAKPFRDKSVRYFVYYHGKYEYD